MAKRLYPKSRPRARILLGMAALLLSLGVLVHLGATAIISLLGKQRVYKAGRLQSGAAATAAPINQQGINLNTATLEELTSLPGIGEYLAGQLILARENQPFHFIEDLGAVKGFGEKRINVIRHLAFVPLPEVYTDPE